jgi:hypothetical protein
MVGRQTVIVVADVKFPRNAQLFEITGALEGSIL